MGRRIYTDGQGQVGINLGANFVWVYMSMCVLLEQKTGTTFLKSVTTSSATYYINHRHHRKYVVMVNEGVKDKGKGQTRTKEGRRIDTAHKVLSSCLKLTGFCFLTLAFFFVINNSS